ncbi:glycoside hydrolase family 6 protein [Micromonospora yasonensis]|uniref:glycoside hydrolase family 6 protein n=1 Tax=Micromonospora yasonensis TaxID=1128667 RepID=UPI00223027A9|nr:glycoside hydrolase family 6 protein [Micromonospora yasonensis]MCW3842632.1 glycoside hydrolase family 6 protein [Micromonospora yasonensis]
MSWPDPQTWCNPPGRGLGLRPTTATGDPLADAFLWVKTPGQSDGQCDRGTGTGHDPARAGMADPAAGRGSPSRPSNW